MNPYAVLALACSLGVFSMARRRLLGVSALKRMAIGGCSLMLGVPHLLVVLYYLHFIPETAWFYEFRSWSGSEFSILPLSVLAATLAPLLNRWSMLVLLTAAAVLPYIKPIAIPLEQKIFKERWSGAACMQSQPSTCGPASVASILKQLGLPASEQAIAMAAHTSGSGTEAWYLARHLRGLGLQVHFLFRDSFDPAVSFPAVVGVKLSSAGHFIAVLGVNGDRVTYADPVIGLKERTLAEFHERYHFTGFHMTVATHENSP